MSPDRTDVLARVRREPPPFRQVTVHRAARRSARLVRVVLAGPELAGLVVDQPAASVRLLLPSAGQERLVMPRWNGNEFLLPDGTRPVIRTLTPRLFDPDAMELTVEVVLHGRGAASTWAETAQPGDPAAVSGPGRGYPVDPDATAFLLAGDETAIPAISQLLETLPAARPVAVHIEMADPAARLPLPDREGTTIEWHHVTQERPPGDTLVDAVAGAELVSGARVWVAGEAAAMQRVRRHLFEERGLPRSHAWVRGYWKRGRAGADSGD